MSFFWNLQRKQKRDEKIYTRSYLKTSWNCGERKRSSRSHGKENNEKLDSRRNKFVLFNSHRPSNKVYIHTRTKGIKKTKWLFIGSVPVLHFWIFSEFGVITMLHENRATILYFEIEKRSLLEYFLSAVVAHVNYLTLIICYEGLEFSGYEIELRNWVTPNDATLRASNLKILKEILLSSY